MALRWRRPSAIISVLLLMALMMWTSSEAVYPMPADGDSCTMYCLRSHISWLNGILDTLGRFPCSSDKIITSDGKFVSPDNAMADRCLDPMKFNETKVNSICNANVIRFFADPLNCDSYYDCSFHVGRRQIKCLPGFLYDDVNKKCRNASDVYCGRRPVTLTPQLIQAICAANPKRILINPQNCNAYYNCSQIYDSSGVMQQYEEECGYLNLFDMDSKTCSNYSQVHCVLRKEIKDACSLKRNTCRSSHCVPCPVLIPSCINQEDGNHPFQRQPFTPRFFHCQEERTTSVDDCKEGFNGRSGTWEPRLFNSNIKECMEARLISRSLGGTKDEENSG